MNPMNKVQQLQALAALLGEAYSSMKDSTLRRQLRNRWEEYPSLKKIMNAEMRKRARSIANASKRPLEGDQYVDDFPDGKATT